MKNDFLVLHRGAGIEYINNRGEGSGGGVAFTGANNGVSLSTVTPGTVVLGQNVGQAGNPAALISSREIPLATFQLIISQIGGAGASSPTSFPIFRTGASTISNTPIYQVQTSGGVEIYSIRIPQDGSSIFMGVGAGAANTGTGNRSVGIGNGALQATIVNFENTAIGFNCMQNGVQTGFQNTAVGSGAFQSNVSGGQSAALGWNAMNNNVSGTNNTAFGGLTLGANVSGSNNVAVGGGAMNESLVATTNPAQNVVVGATAVQQASLGSNNIVIGFANTFNQLIGNGNIFIGASGGALANISNTTLIGTAQTSTISNIVGLGIATQNVIIGITAITADLGSTLQLNGSFAAPILVVAVNTTLTSLMHSVVFTATATATLPTAASSTNRIYVITASGAAVTVTTSINYNNLSNVAVNTIVGPSSVIIQSDGTTWRQIK